jgi:drug/metabolite transporter (DMT)-like permease
MKTMRNATSRIDVAPVLLAAVVWGFNWPVTRIALQEVGPWTMRAVTLLLGAVALAFVALLRKQPFAIPRDQWRRMAAAGSLTVGGFAILTTLAQLSLPTSRAAVLAYTMPIWAALMARVVLGERFTSRRTLGLVLGISGLAALAVPLFRAGEISLGWVYAIGAAVCWAAGTIVSKRFPVKAPPLIVAGWQLLVGGSLCLAGMLAFEAHRFGEHYSPSTIAALTYSVLLAQAVGYVCWFEGIARVPAGTAALASLLAPALGVFGAMAMLGEQPSMTDFLGLALVLTASATVVLPSRSGC